MFTPLSGLTAAPVLPADDTPSGAVKLLVQIRKAVSNFTQSWCRDRRTGSKNVTGSPSVLSQEPFLAETPHLTTNSVLAD